MVWYLKRVAATRARQTTLNYGSTLDRLLGFLGEGATTDDVTGDTVADFYAHVRAEGVSLGTARGYVTRVERFLREAWESEAWGEWFRRPTRLRLPKVPRQHIEAATWAECDRVLHWLETTQVPHGNHHRRMMGPGKSFRWHRDALLIQRYTGLRIGTCLGLLWSDVDLGRATLHIRADNDKVRWSRTVPVPAALVDELAGWGRREGFVVRVHEGCKRVQQGTVLRKAWEGAGVRERVWKRRTTHALRRAYISGMRGLGADEAAVRYLVGHSPDVHHGYVDWRALPLEATVGLVPVVGAGEDVAALGRREVSG